MAKTRQELINQVEWNSGGYGFGICRVAGMMIWSEDRPDPENGKPDLKSVVAICGDPKKYTKAELAQIVEFANKQTARYDEMFRWRRGCNMILIDKEEFNGRPTGRWMRKRLTWESGPMYSANLTDAIAVFQKEWI